MSNSSSREQSGPCRLTINSDVIHNIHMQEDHARLLQTYTTNTSPQDTGEDEVLTDTSDLSGLTKLASNCDVRLQCRVEENQDSTVPVSHGCDQVLDNNKLKDNLQEHILNTTSGQDVVANSLKNISEQIGQDENSFNKLCVASRSSNRETKLNDQQISQNNSSYSLDKQHSVRPKKQPQSHHDNSMEDATKDPMKAQSQCYKKLVSFYKENSSIPRFSMFPCSDCSEHFVDSISRQIHVMQKHADLLSSCEMCHKIFATNGEKKRHIKLTHGRLNFIDGVATLKFPCKVCNTVEFDCLQELVSHSPCAYGAAQKLSKYKPDTLKMMISRRNSRDNIAKKQKPSSEHDEGKEYSFDYLNDHVMVQRSYSSSQLQDKLVCDDQLQDKLVCDDQLQDKLVCDDQLQDKLVCDDQLHDKLVCDDQLVMPGGYDGSADSVCRTIQTVIGDGDREELQAPTVQSGDDSDLISQPQTSAQIDGGDEEKKSENTSSSLLLQPEFTKLEMSAEIGGDDDDDDDDTSSSLLLQNDNEVEFADEADERLRMPVCPTSENDDGKYEQIGNIPSCVKEEHYHPGNMPPCVQVESYQPGNMPSCVSGESYHFSEGGESWTISTNIDHDAEMTSQPFVEDGCDAKSVVSESSLELNNESWTISTNTDHDAEMTSQPFVEDGCDDKSVLSESFRDCQQNNESWTISRNIDHDDEEMTSQPFVEDGCADKSVLNESSRDCQLNGETSIDNTDSCAVSYGTLVKLEAIVSPDDGVDWESCSLCDIIFNCSLKLKEHIRLCHQENVTHDSMGVVSVDRQENVTHDSIGLVSSDHQKNVTHDSIGLVSSDHQENVTQDSMRVVSVDHQVNVKHESMGIVNFDSSLETCDLCNETFQSLLQMKDHIKYVHCSTLADCTSALVTNGTDQHVPLTMQVLPTYADGGTASSELVFVQNTGCLIKTESFSETNPEVDLNFPNLQVLMTEKDKTLGMKEARVKRRYRKRKSKLLGKESDSVHSLSRNDDENTAAKKGRKRQKHIPNKRYSLRKYSTAGIIGNISQPSKSVEKTEETHSELSNSANKTDDANIPELPMLADKTQANISELLNSTDQLDFSSYNVDSSPENTNLRLAETISCCHCKEVFDKQSNFVNHVVLEHPEHLHSCDLCRKVFPYLFLKQAHMTTCHDVQPVVPVSIVKSNHLNDLFQCMECSETFANKMALTIHTLVRHSKNYLYYPCDMCDKVFAYPGLRRKHMASSHFMMACDVNKMADAVILQSSDDAQICDVKSRDGNTRDGNTRDGNTHVEPSASERQQLCIIDTVCIPTALIHASATSALSSSSVTNLPFTNTSAICHTSGTQVDDMLRMEPLTNLAIPLSALEEPRSTNNCWSKGTRMLRVTRTMYPCKFCGEEFDSSNKLANHAISVHTVVKLRSVPSPSAACFPCKFCGKSFSCLGKLGDHAVTAHRQSMPQARYPCECGKQFTTTSSLALHLRYSCGHNGESRPASREPIKPVHVSGTNGRLTCQFCDHSFLSPSHLVNHTNRSHPSNVRKYEYPCHCGKVLHSRKEFRIHQFDHIALARNVPRKCRDTPSKALDEQELFNSVLKSVFEAKPDKTKAGKKRKIDTVEKLPDG